MWVRFKGWASTSKAWLYLTIITVFVLLVALSNRGSPGNAALLERARQRLKDARKTAADAAEVSRKRKETVRERRREARVRASKVASDARREALTKGDSDKPPRKYDTLFLILVLALPRASYAQEVPFVGPCIPGTGVWTSEGVSKCTPCLEPDPGNVAISQPTGCHAPFEGVLVRRVAYDEKAAEFAALRALLADAENRLAVEALELDACLDESERTAKQCVNAIDDATTIIDSQSTPWLRYIGIFVAGAATAIVAERFIP